MLRLAGTGASLVNRKVYGGSPEMASECLFCKIVAGEIPTQRVHEDEHVLAFRDIAPQAPTHILIIPRKHISSINEATEEDETVLGRLLLTAKLLAASEGLAEDGYRLTINTGDHGGQTVYHIHLHLLGGRQMRWPPG